MTYYTAADLRQRAGGMTAAAANTELSRSSKTVGAYDIFLSHSFRDAVLIYGLKQILEADGSTVYVDWIDDPHLNRSFVTPSTAAQLRRRMTDCRSLVYALSQNASASRWMPWELGYFDGAHGDEKVAICPIQTGAGSFDGAEYIGLYKTLEKAPSAGAMRPHVVRPSSRQAERMSSFVTGSGLFYKAL